MGRPKRNRTATYPCVLANTYLIVVVKREKALSNFLIHLPIHTICYSQNLQYNSVISKMRHLGFSVLCLVCLVGASLAQDLGTLIPKTLFDEMLKHRSEPPNCQGGFYTYDAFITAAQSFAGFASAGDADTRKKEIAAFFAQTSHETTGGSGWAAAPDGPYAWGYCFVEERGANPDTYCHPEKAQWPCAPNKKYFGRGPIQLTGNENYGQAGTAIQSELLANPELVATDPIISFKTALWFWMTPQAPKPSCHDVITGAWTPSAEDNAASRVAGFGLITNIINGGIECGKGADDRVADRIGFYRRYCDMLGVSPGENLDCYGQRAYPA